MRLKAPRIFVVSVQNTQQTNIRSNF